MNFDTFVAIDWSGSKNATKSIQVAQCQPDSDVVRLTEPNSGGRWTRTKVWEYLEWLLRERVALVGFDFAFAYPFCDRQAYFPGHARTPPDVRSLWETVESICSSAPDLYGGPFYKHRDAPFADYLLYQKYKGQNYQERFRITEKACKGMGTSPASVFKCVGVGVGCGSVAGFRLLHRIAQSRTASVWPFWKSATSNGSTVVEIFPQVFLQQAGVNRRSVQNHERIRQALDFYKVTLLDGRAGNDFSEDERDALISAAGLRRLSETPSLWKATEMSCAAYEGWIFGIS